LVSKLKVGVVIAMMVLSGCKKPETVLPTPADNLELPIPTIENHIVTPKPSKLPYVPPKENVESTISVEKLKELINTEPPLEQNIKSIEAPVLPKGVTVLGKPTEVIGVGGYYEEEVLPVKVIRPLVEVESQDWEQLESLPQESFFEGHRSLGNFLITAYDLSFDSTEKVKGDKDYGITASGKSLIGLSWDKAKSVAVDKSVIPLGTRLYLKFNQDRYTKYNGVYTAVDVGGAVKGNHLDFFLGDFDNYYPDPSVKDFGKTQAAVFIFIPE
jgi:3D (Asp-Asp-Asp) domain-containing protein